MKISVICLEAPGLMLMVSNVIGFCVLRLLDIDVKRARDVQIYANEIE